MYNILDLTFEELQEDALVSKIDLVRVMFNFEIKIGAKNILNILKKINYPDIIEKLSSIENSIIRYTDNENEYSNEFIYYQNNKYITSDMLDVLYDESRPIEGKEYLYEDFVKNTECVYIHDIILFYKQIDIWCQKNPNSSINQCYEDLYEHDDGIYYLKHLLIKYWKEFKL